MRIPLAATGAVLAGCGLLALRLGDADPARPVRDPALDRFAAVHGWFLPALAGLAEIVAFAGTLWLMVQLRTLVERWRPDVDRATRVRARAGALRLRQEARALAGVRDVRVRLTGSLDRPRLIVTVVCAGDTDLGEVYGALGAGALTRYRGTVELPDLPVVVRFRLVFRSAAPEPDVTAAV
ncbi:hypothetical protein [Spirillospora albida]|uniref:hypothetical protein n=1 Tax=Spirillospora albida TaxID=58123 RepID=UPI0004C06A6E|nr:hypothetical protein [Spirillospora albida]